MEGGEVSRKVLSEWCAGGERKRRGETDSLESGFRCVLSSNRPSLPFGARFHLLLPFFPPQPHLSLLTASLPFLPCDNIVYNTRTRFEDSPSREQTKPLLATSIRPRPRPRLRPQPPFFPPSFPCHIALPFFSTHFPPPPLCPHRLPSSTTGAILLPLRPPPFVLPPLPSFTSSPSPSHPLSSSFFNFIVYARSSLVTQPVPVMNRFRSPGRIRRRRTRWKSFLDETSPS